MRFYHLTIGPVPHKASRRIFKADKEFLSNRARQQTLVYSSYVEDNPYGEGYVASSNPRAIYDSGALDIEFTLDHVSLNKFTLASIRIYGVDSDVLNQAANMKGREVMLQAGMGKGFPICNPDLVGLLVRGVVVSGVEDRQDKNNSLTLYIKPFIEEHDKVDLDDLYRKKLITDDNKKKLPKNVFIVNLPKGTSVKDALLNCVRPHFKDYKIDFQSTLAERLVSDKDFSTYYESFEAFAYDMGANGREKSIWVHYTGRPLYIFVHDKTIIFTDGTTGGEPKKIRFEEMIGQAMWGKEDNSIEFTCMMRGDITIGQKIMLPIFNEKGGSVQNGMNDVPSTKNQSRFSGVFYVTQANFVGKFRSKKGEEWAVTYTAKPFTQSKKD